MDRVSLSSIFSFMQMQYLRAIAGVAPGSPLLSSMHWLTHVMSSAFIFCADAGAAAKLRTSAVATNKHLMMKPLSKPSGGQEWTRDHSLVTWRALLSAPGGCARERLRLTGGNG